MRLKSFVCLIITTIFIFTGCNQAIEDASQNSTSSTDAETSITDINPIEIVGTVRENVDFLTEEQWDLFDKAHEYASSFILQPGAFGQENNPPSSSKEINGHTYKRYVGSTYTGWGDFYDDMLAVFTKEYFQELNTVQIRIDEPKQNIYVNIDGKLYYLDMSSGGNITHLKDMDRFDLITSNEKILEFNQIVYFCDSEDVQEENPTPKSVGYFPVTMVKTNDGWRISDYTFPR